MIYKRIAAMTFYLSEFFRTIYSFKERI